MSVVARPQGDGAPIFGDGEPQLAVFRRRFVVLFLLSLSMMSNAILWIGFAPISSLTQSYYGVSAASVNSLSVIYLAIYVPVSFMTNYFFNHFGTRNGMLLASVLNAAGGLVRWLSTDTNSEARGESAFLILVAGQVLGALAQPFLTNVPARIGSLWFPENQRDLATVLGALSNPIGVALGQILPTLYVNEAAQTVRMFDLLLFQCVFAGVMFVLTVLFFKDKPPLPPSLSEHGKLGDATKPNMLQEFKKLFSNRQFNILMFTFSVGVGFFNALATLIEQLVGKAGYTSNDAGLFAALMLGAGVFSAIGSGAVLNKTHAYNPMLKSFVVFFYCMVVALMLLLRPDAFGPLLAVFIVMGLAMLPLLPLTLQCAAECTYPMNEDISTGALMSSGKISGVVFIYIMGGLLDEQPDYGDGYVFEPTYIFTVGMSTVFLISTMFYHGEYKRLEAGRPKLAPSEP